MRSLNERYGVTTQATSLMVVSLRRHISHLCAQPSALQSLHGYQLAWRQGAVSVCTLAQYALRTPDRFPLRCRVRALPQEIPRDRGVVLTLVAVGKGGLLIHARVRSSVFTPLGEVNDGAPRPVIAGKASLRGPEADTTPARAGQVELPSGIMVELVGSPEALVQPS